MVVFNSRTRDDASFEEYAARALASVTVHGGSAVLFGPLSILHGPSHFDHGAIFSFADRRSAEAWYSSDDYQALSGLRADAMDCSIAIVG